MSKFKERLGKLSPKKRLYALETLPGHLAESVQGERLHQLLTDFDFIEAKLDAIGVQGLIEDYDLARVSDVLLSEGQGESLGLIQGAIRKSAHILDKDKTQLVEHLLGRLLDFEIPEIQGMLEQARQSKDSVWLRPLNGNLERPGEGCLRTLIGHTGSVTAVAIAPDGKTAISASADDTLKIWDIESGSELRTLTGHTHWVRAVEIAPDGKTAISASRDKTLKIWDIESGTQLLTLTGHTYDVNAVAIAPDGKIAISASLDDTLKIWDIKMGTELLTLTGHTDGVIAVAITPDGKTAISASDDKTLAIWDIDSGTELLTLTGHNFLSRVKAVAIAPDGKTAISALNDKTLKIWDIETGTELLTLTGHTGWVNAVAIAADGKTVISASDDKTLKIWDIESGTELLTFASHTSSVNAVAIAADGKTSINAVVIVTEGQKTPISDSCHISTTIWDIKDGTERLMLTGNDTPWIRAVATAADGKTVISASDDNTVKIRDIESGTERLTLTGHTSSVRAVAIARDGKTAISASLDNTLKIWDLFTGEEIASFSGDSGFNCCAILADGVTVVAGDVYDRFHYLRLEGMGEFWLEKAKALFELERYEQAICCLDLAIKIELNDCDILVDQSKAFAKSDRYEEAIDYFDKALEIHRIIANTFAKKACIYALQSNVELSLENLRHAIKLEPERYRELAKTDVDFDGIRGDARFQELLLE